MGLGVYVGQTTTAQHRVGTIEGNTIYRGPTAAARRLVATISGPTIYRGPVATPSAAVATVRGSGVYRATDDTRENRIATIDGTDIYRGRSTTAEHFVGTVDEGATPQQVGGAAAFLLLLTDATSSSGASTPDGDRSQPPRHDQHRGDQHQQSASESAAVDDRSAGAYADEARTALELTLEEAYSGVEKRVTLDRNRTCQSCRGSGTRRRRRCGACDGDGYRRTSETVTVDIPAGVESGQTLRIDRQAPSQSQSDEVLIDITVAPHEQFERDGADLYYDLELSFLQAVFGDTVEIPTIDGTVKLDVPAGTQSDDVFRLGGKGMPRLRERGDGDLFVRLQIPVPEQLSDQQRRALSAYAEASDESARPESAPTDRDEVIAAPAAEPADTASKPRRGGPAQTATVDRSPAAGGSPSNENTADPTPNTSATSSTPDASTTSSTPEAESAKAERVDNLERQLARTKREFSEYKSRSEQRKQQAETDAIADLLSGLVDVRDDLTRALAEEHADAGSLRDGVRITLKNLDRVLFDDYLTEIDPDPGTAVDYTRHEVVSAVESSHSEGAIATCLASGYELDGRVIKPARVTVSDGTGQ